jgi:hypothetical protein
MKNLLLTSIVLGLTAFGAHAQMVYDYSYGLGSTGADLGKCVTLEASNTVISAGVFAGTVDFDASAATSNLTNSGGASDMYILRYNSGGAFMWVIQIAGTGVETPRSITNDGSGNIYVCGRFSGTADFDPTTGTTSITSAGGNDAFVAKYAAATGALIWAFNIGSAGEDAATCVSLSSAGDVLVCGDFSSSPDFDPSATTTTLTSGGGTDIFFAKYTTGSALTWAKNCGSPSDDIATGISDDGSGNIFLCGAFGGNTADMDPSASTASLTCAGVADMFVGKYTSLGAYTWALRVGGGASDGATDLTVYSGDVYVTGSMGTGTIDFDPGAGTTNLVNAGGTDAFAAKYTSAGVFSWLIPLQSTGNDVGQNIESDANAYIYVSGVYSATVDCDPSAAAANITCAGGTDFFICRYNSTGTYKTSNGFGSAGNEDAPGLAINGLLKLVYLTGAFTNTVDLNPAAATNNVVSAGSSDIYVVRFSWTAPLRLSGVGAASFYPNPVSSTLCINDAEEHAKIELFTADGKKAGSWPVENAGRFTLDMQTFADGIYLLRITSPDGSFTTDKIIVQH